MMGYTHVVVGASAGISTALVTGQNKPEVYVAAATLGALGGIAPDIDAKDDDMVTDAGRCRLATLGLIIIAIAGDFIFSRNILGYINAKNYLALGGAIGFLILLLLGRFAEHRGFTHSFLFLILTTVCIYCIDKNMWKYYAVGCISHLLLDFINKKGLQLWYPIHLKKGWALHICYASKTANKVFYWMGLVLFVTASGLYLYIINDVEKMIMPIVIIVYMIIVMHFVRRKSEKELRHIMHIKGEL